MFAERTTVGPKMSVVYPAVFELQADLHGISTIAYHSRNAVWIFKNRVIEIIDKNQVKPMTSKTRKAIKSVKNDM
jgi:hypothetical protein